MVSWSNYDGCLRINWYASVGQTDHTDLTNIDPAVDSQEQTIKLGAYVTDVTVVNEQLMIIASITNWSVGGGKLVIYEQPLDWSGPNPMAYFDSDGVERVSVKIPKLGKKRELFAETVSTGRLGVRHLWNLRTDSLSNSTGLLVQFHDSGDVYSLDRTSLNMQRVVSPDTSITGVLHAPGTERYSHYNGTYFQASTGFVYAAGNPRQTHHLFMIDGDMDGILDHAEYMTAADWAVYNGVNGSNWDHYGN